MRVILKVLAVVGLLAVGIYIVSLGEAVALMYLEDKDPEDIRV